MKLAVVHTLGGGIISATNERLAWLNRSGGRVRAELVAPERRRTVGRSGFFFPVQGELPNSYHRDYEEAVVREVIPALYEAHAQIGFDAIDAHDGTALIAASIVASKLHIPIVHTIHSHELIERFHEGPSPELQAAVETTDTFIGVSNYIAEAHEPIVRKTVHVSRNPVPAGVIPRTYRPSEAGMRAIFVGRLETAKGFDLLLAAADILGQRPDLTISVVGASVDDVLAKRALDKAPLIRLLGKVDEPRRVYELLATHDVFLFPTRKEACSMALLEAIGAGLAIIASDIQPNREVAGKAAVFHSDGDAGHLAECILNVLQGAPTMQTLSASAAQQARYFSPAIVFRELDDLYASLGSR